MVHRIGYLVFSIMTRDVICNDMSVLKGIPFHLDPKQYVVHTEELIID